MEKVRNPYKGIPGYECFGCAPDNEHGLRMKFHRDGDEIVSVWRPESYFRGYGNILHGGIHGALMDEIASWVVFAVLGTSGTTAKMELRYKRPVRVDRGEITLRAKLSEMKRNIAIIEVSLYDNDQYLCSKGVLHYFTVTEKIAKEQYHYPGREAFNF